MNSVVDVFSDETDHRQCRRWMCDAQNVGDVATAFRTTEKNAKVLLSFLYMHHERGIIFDDIPLDNVLKRLVNGIFERVRQRDEGVMQAVERANVVFEAWKRRDEGRVLQFLSESCISAARRGEDVSEEDMALITAIGGEEAAENTRQRCARFERVAPENLETRIAEIADQARWDLMRERVASGDVEGTLFPLLQDLQRGIVALLSASPNTSESFTERFDVEFLLERHRNGSLGRVDVGQYADLVATMIGRLQAPVDDAVVQPWVRRVRAEAVSNSPLAEYLPSLVDFVREAGIHLQRVVSRLQQFSRK